MGPKGGPLRDNWDRSSLRTHPLEPIASEAGPKGPPQKCLSRRGGSFRNERGPIVPEGTPLGPIANWANIFRLHFQVASFNCTQLLLALANVLSLLAHLLAHRRHRAPISSSSFQSQPNLHQPQEGRKKKMCFIYCARWIKGLAPHADDLAESTPERPQIRALHAWGIPVVTAGLASKLPGDRACQETLVDVVHALMDLQKFVAMESLLLGLEFLLLGHL